MQGLTYNWNRHWVPREGAFSFDDEGFLRPSDGPYADWFKTDAILFDKLLSKPCLILLGEPGIGKSYAMLDAAKRETKAREHFGATFLFRNLGIYDSDSRLIEDLFESAEFKNWQKSGGELHVFLDSFDECLFRVDAVANLLAEHFARLPSVANLFIRIASRTAEWRTSLEDAIRQKLGDDNISVLELAPLTREQVIEAAKSNNVDPERFVRELVKSEVVPFAIKPLTLDLLIRIWRKEGSSLPATQREIYEKGCLELCTDTDRRQTPKLRRTLSSDQRLAVASRIFAGLLCCNRSAVWMGSRQNPSPEADIALADFTGGHVNVDSHALIVTESSVREALDTGLFTSRGRNRMSWAHQTYAEFLAARYLVQEGLNTRQVLDILTHPHDPDRKLIPQLHETAAWVAGANSEVFKRLTTVQPDVLLRSDVATADERAKSSLVEALLSAFSSESIHTDVWAIRRRYRKLKNPSLSAQLQRYLRKGHLTADAQVEAIEMTDNNDFAELFPLLAKIALNKSRPQTVREWAADVISRKGEFATKRMLRPLALGDTGADPNDELRGIGLKACWPGHLSASELFSSLTKSTDQINGTYHSFLSYDLVDKLAVSDLPFALSWAARQPEQHDSYLGGYFGLVRQILDKAVLHLDEGLVLTSFAHTLLARLDKHDFSDLRGDSPLISALESRPELRLQLVTVLVPLFQDSKNDSFHIARHGLRLVNSENLEWLLKQLRSSTDSKVQSGYAHLVNWVFYPDSVSRIDSVVEAAQTIPALAETLSYWLEPAQLDSARAQKERLFLIEDKRDRRAELRQKRKILSPTPGEWIVKKLAEFESGDIDAWWRISRVLEIEDNGQYCKRSHQVDIRGLVGWQKATNETRARLVAAAYQYVSKGEPRPEEWFSKKNIIHFPSAAGFRALYLLANEARGQFDILPPDVWQRWMSAILRPHHYDELDAHLLLTTKAFENSARNASDWAIKVIVQENSEGENLWLLSKLPEVWPFELAVTLLRQAATGQLKPNCRHQLLEALLKHQVPGTFDLLRKLIPRKAPKRQPTQLTTRYAAQLLMAYGEPIDWSKIWCLVQEDSAFGRGLLEGIGHFHTKPGPILKILREQDIGALWEWMLKQFPVVEDPNPRHSGEVTLRHSMANFRDALISHLADFGTAKACEELQGLIIKYPQFIWIRRALQRGQEEMRRLTWKPPTPNQLFQLAETQRARFIQSGRQLLEAVEESLDVLQAALSGERHMAQFLWNGKRPVEEEAISDWVANHLESDLKHRGVVLGREVQIHRFDKTDIHITAVTHDGRTGSIDAVKVIIEVKGCWHRKLRSAMKTQLVDRYLADNDCCHGLYLTAWFPQDVWDKADRRRKQVPFRKRTDSEIFLSAQAQSLSKLDMTIHSKVVDFSNRRPANQMQIKGKRSVKNALARKTHAVRR